MTTISVTVVEADPETRDGDVRLLRDELNGLDVEELRFGPGGTVPEGAKGLDPETLTTIIVTLSGSPVLIQLGRVLGQFVTARKRKVVVRDGDRTMEIQGPIDETAKQAIDSFFRTEIER